ncbi:hypothetical protein MTR67_012461 [Solanum verrucosum]|uniref:Uncharacterized protein n=1 Tax=Solanum verrucosum TaxID=315347 RepID=A0AAF0QEJ2_SOLVR|nr:hypothetical protein MTR67_012461 [Solanum verrucosum]
MDTIEQNGPRQLKERRKESVPSPDQENQVGGRKELSASHRTVLRCSAISPKVQNLKMLRAKAKGRWNTPKGCAIFADFAL